MRDSDWLHLPPPRARLRTLSFITCCIATIWAGPVAAVDCGAIPNSRLSTQDQVTNFQALYGPCDTVVGNLIIEYADISDLTGLAGLKSVSGSLLLYYTTNLPSLAGLEGLTQVGELGIEAARLLTSLAGLENLASTGSLHIVRNANLPDLNGLPQTLPSVFNLEVFGNPRMTSLEGMPAFGEISHSLRIGENDILADITALGSSSFPVGDSPQVDISVNSNPLLTSLSGLPATDKVQTLSITDNCALSSLGGLESLVEVWSGLVIFDNTALSDCSALKVVLDDVDDGTAGPSFGPEDPPDSPGLAFIWIEKNLVGCNSMGQILATAPAEIIFANGLEGCVVY
jgi:hypothetical protein